MLFAVQNHYKTKNLQSFLKKKCVQKFIFIVDFVYSKQGRDYCLQLWLMYSYSLPVISG